MELQESELQDYANAMVWMTLNDIRRVFGFKTKGFATTYTSRGLLDQAQVISARGSETTVYGMTLVHYMEMRYIRRKKVGNPDIKFEINDETIHFFHSNVAKRVLTVVDNRGVDLSDSNKVKTVLQDVHRVGELLYGFTDETLNSEEGLFTLFAQNEIDRKAQDYQFLGFRFHPHQRVQEALAQYPNLEKGAGDLVVGSPNADQIDLRDTKARADETRAVLERAFKDSDDLDDDIERFLEAVLFDDDLPKTYRRRAKDLMLRQAVANQ